MNETADSRQPGEVEAPETLTVQQIMGEPNAEVRRIMMDRFGNERFLRESGARLLAKDDWGEVYRQDIPNDVPLVMVKCVNSTAEPDGTIKDYWLRIDPDLRPLLPDGRLGRPQKISGLNAVASTFGLRGKEYAPVAQS